MRAVEPWVEGPLATFVSESSARIALLMTGAGQVVAQHGFARSLDVMSASALGAGIVASTRALAEELGTPSFGAIVHQGKRQGFFLAPFDLPEEGSWIALVVFGPDTSLGVVQLFFGRLVAELIRVAPHREAPRAVLPETFEDDLNASLRALFGR